MTNPSTDKLKLILVSDMLIMLTITLSNKQQYVSYKKTKSRTARVFEDYTTHIIPLLKDNAHAYEMCQEISEALSSEGKYFPRLHYHILIKIKNSVNLLMDLGHIQDVGYGYHITTIENQEKLDHYKKYIKKQHKEWNESRYTMFYNRQFNIENLIL